MTRRQLEIESLADFDAAIGGAKRLDGWFVRAVDLTGRSDRLHRVDPGGAVFLGCRFEPGVADELTEAGALVFPELGRLPFQPYRPGLYTPDELYGTGRYAASTDSAIYAWSRAAAARRRLVDDLATTLHDHAITDALDDDTEHLDPTALVGVMGGHDLRPGDPAYQQAAELGLALSAAGRLVVTGGGPGAMEAANLGAYLAPWPDALGPALELLARGPTYRDSIQSWLQSARSVRERWPADGAGRSLSIPTWFYGHEPTNLFATAIAKYFSNALREDTLLHRCRGGIVFLPGAAGTVQEIFQASTENYYAATSGLVAPLVLVVAEYWTSTVPAWPLVERLGEHRAMSAQLHLVDTAEQAAALILDR